MYDAGHAMDRALELGESARRHSPPNPWVGCVIVRDGTVVGEGATMPPGGPHAEIVALERAGPRARGATAFVTLEPCAHHGRTPPCAEALLDAGLARVVIALEDPDPRVAGAGAAHLRDHGLAVEIGAGADLARESLAPYLHHRHTGRAWCLVKTAMSLDGRIAAADGSSRWITGPEARADGHRLRAESQAIVVGAGTALADRPTLTARDVQAPGDRQPLRVVVDARGRVPADGPLFDAAVAPTLIITTEAAPSHVVDAWRAAGAKVETVAAATGGVDLEAALGLLGSHGVLQALVEGGGEVHGALLTAGLVDRVVAYVAPTVLGADGLAAFGGHTVATLANARRWELRTVTRLGADVRLEYDCHAGTS